MKTQLMDLLMVFALSASSQSNQFPVKEWRGPASFPFVFYITGDGGLNKFSSELCAVLNKSGYSVAALNAKSYFWDKKTPEIVATDLNNYLQKQFKNRTDKQWMLIGYSFGADVSPFVINQLPDSTKKNLSNLILLSPTRSTDFEVHLIDMIGSNSKRSMNVLNEINKLGALKTATIFGSNEDDFPAKEIKLKNYSNESLPGGHHFDGNVPEVAKKIISHLK